MRSWARSPEGRSRSRGRRTAGRLVLVAALAVPAARGEEATMLSQVHEAARARARPTGAPRYSDVSMRLFRKRPDREEIEAGKAFHITRADWSYIADADYIRAVHHLGWSFQGTTNAVTHNEAFALRDNAGQPVLDHFKKPGRYWADIHNAAYRAWYRQRLLEWVELGVDSLQRDEPTAIRHYDIGEAAAFLQTMHAELDRRAGRHVPVSVNLAWNGSVFGGRGEPVTRLFDFGMAELGRRHVRPAFLWQAARDAAARGKAIIYTAYHDLGVPTYRLAFAGCYATGMQFIVPWDQYGGVGKPRVFCKPADLADLTGFVRANASLLERTEDAAAVGPGIQDGRWRKQPPVRLQGGSGKLSAFVRATPGEAAAPVAVHLVEWGKPQPAQVGLRTGAFSGGQPLRAELRVPVAYDAAAHTQAEQRAQQLREAGERCGPGQAEAYAPLSRSLPLATRSEGAWTWVEVPPLTPWGILVVRAKARR